MDIDCSRSVEMGPPPRPPLITPSASPPVSRVLHSIKADRPSAPKRPRLSSTPSGSSSARHPPSSSNFQSMKFESSSRLFQFWDELAGRYNKPLDEDDIVDLRELDIVKDRGVTRSITRNLAIGSLTACDTEKDADDADTQDAEGVDEGEGEEDDSTDELDLISPPAVPVNMEYYKNWYVPPADERNPEDAEAFREFEEAEKKRRELFGDEEDEQEEEEEEDLNIAFVQLGANDGTVEEADKDEPVSPSPKPIPQRRQSRTLRKPVDDDSSEDELATWVIDETSIPPRRSALPPDDIIDLTDSRSPSPPLAPAPRGRSQSLPPRTPSRARSRAWSKSKASAAYNRPRTPRQASSPEQVLQLFTPPRSSSAVEAIQSLHDEEPPLPPMETPSPKFPKPRLRYTPRPRTPSDDGYDELPGSSNDTDEEDVPLSTLLPVPKKIKASPKGIKPEVIIVVSAKTSKMLTHPRPSSDQPSSPTMTATKRKINKDQAKSLAVGHPSAKSPSLPKASRSQSQPRSPTEEVDSPQPRPPPKGTKRRRVSSLSSLSDGSPTKAVTPPASSSSTQRRYNARSRLRLRSGYSSDIAPPTSSPVPSGDEDDEDIKRSGRSHSRANTLAPQMLSFPQIYPPIPPLYTPRHNELPSASGHSRVADQQQHPYPPSVSLQDPQAQFMLAQVWQNMSYLMSASGFRPPPIATGYPPGLPSLPTLWPSCTPSHQRHHTHPSHSFGTPSSEAGPSRPSVYSTPTHHPHPYPYSYNPASSGSTLPPSSPIMSSPASSSPVLRPASVPPGQRSRSKGRRVSFKLDTNDRPPPPTPPKHAEPEDDDEYPSVPVRRRGTDTSALSKFSKGKGKARAEPRREEEESEEELPIVVTPARGCAAPRARTPGPPSQRAKGVPHTKEPKSAKRKE